MEKSIIEKSIIEGGGDEALSRIDLFGTLRRRKWLIVLGALAGLALATAYCVLRGPFYESSARVLVIKRQLETAPITGPSPATVLAEDSLPMHEAIITSRRIVEHAVHKNNLQSLPSFQGGKDATAAILGSLSIVATTKKTGGAPNNVLGIAFAGRSPSDCSTILNAVITSYQEFLEEDYASVNRKTLELITRLRDDLQKDLDAKEAAYREFRQNTPQLWKGKAGGTIHQDRLFVIDAKRSGLRMRQVEIQASLKEIHEAAKNGRPRAELLTLASGLPSNREILTASPLLPAADAGDSTRPGRLTLEEELIHLRLQESNLMQRFGPNHPRVQSVANRMETVRGLMTPTGTGKNVDSADSLSSKEDFVDLKIQLLEQELQENKRAEKSLAELFEHEQKEAKTSFAHEAADESFRKAIERSQLLYESARNRLQEINSVKGSGGYDTLILAPAEEGKPASKKYLLALAFALCVGLFGGFGGALLVEMADKSFRSAQEIVRGLGTPVVGHIPRLPFPKKTASQISAELEKLDPLLCTYYRADSLEADSFRGMRTALFRGTTSPLCKIVQITSPSQGDGKTTLVANLAVSIAQSGKKVLLIDADLRRPRLHKVYGLPNDIGLTSVLAGHASLTQAVQETAIPSLAILPSGPFASIHLELLTATRAKALFDLVRDLYDLVLIDTPPLLTASDASILATVVDGVLLAIRNAKNARPRAQQARELLNTLGATTLGVIVNGVDQVLDYTGYHYVSDNGTVR